MINPGVINLVSLQNVENSHFPYRFDIEDNIGEAIHIHFKDMRIDLTVEEFTILANSMYDIIDGIVDVDGFSSHDFDPVVLVGISETLPKLKNVIIRNVHLEDIKVDTFNENGEPIIADISKSRVYKSLNGIDEENDNHKIQFNFYQHMGTDKISNKERVLYNLEQVKKHGYPYNNELIGLNANNEIWDGQHRAACLYFLYGNKEIPVRELVYGDTEELKYIQKLSTTDMEYELFLAEQQKVKDKNCKKCSKATIATKLKNIIYRFCWQTVRKADFANNEMRERLVNIEKLLREKQ